MSSVAEFAIRNDFCKHSSTRFPSWCGYYRQDISHNIIIMSCKCSLLLSNLPCYFRLLLALVVNREPKNFLPLSHLRPPRLVRELPATTYGLRDELRTLDAA